MSTHNEKLQWHPAFFEAIQAELVDYKDILTYEAEHSLTTEPLRIDVIIIKKVCCDSIITKNIGKIFRAVNIVEYKSPEDSFTISDFHKCMAYADLYMSFNNKQIHDVTLTITITKHPRKVVSYLRTAYKYDVESTSPGLYAVLGHPFPIQIIETNMLPYNENIWLTGLSPNIDPVNLKMILDERNKIKDKIRISTLFNVIAKANPATLSEVFKMKKAKITLEQVLAENGIFDDYKANIDAKWEAVVANMRAEMQKKVAEMHTENLRIAEENAFLRAQLNEKQTVQQ